MLIDIVRGVVWGLGIVLGFVVGGVFIELKVIWRWVFYINFCISVLFVFFYLWYFFLFCLWLNEIMMVCLCEFDVVGVVIFIGVIISLIMVMNFGGMVYGWNSG